MKTVKGCGLCGDNNGDKRADIRTAQQCIAQSVQAAALSFRIQQSCSPLNAQQQYLKAQQQNCAEKQITRTPLTQMMKTEKCSQMKHLTMRQGDRLCISQVQLVQCGSGCVPRSMITRPVPFVCLPANRDRVNQLYEEKVRRGEVLPELKNMEKAFSADIQTPASCSHPAAY